jgi:hypothetical protein
VTIYRVFGDDLGATHLARVELPATEGGDDHLRKTLAIRDIPVTTMNVTELLERMPDGALHTPPRRQLVVVLRGEMEITTTAGDQRRFRAGDGLVADDLDTKGHVTRDVGDDLLITLAIGIDSEWRCPGC